MLLSRRPLQLLLLLSSAIITCAAASWGFTDATVSIQGKGTGVGGGVKEKYDFDRSSASGTGLTTPHRLVAHTSLPKAVQLGAADTLKIILTTQEGKTAKRPHQAFLLLKDADTGLDISYPFSVKESGKAKVDLVGANNAGLATIVVLTCADTKGPSDAVPQVFETNRREAGNWILRSEQRI